jgi:hypothetical protein
VDILYFVRVKVLGGLTMVFAGEIGEKKKTSLRQSGSAYGAACFRHV